MKFIFSILFISVSQICYSQITFEEVLTFEKKSFKEIQAALFEQYTIIRDEKEYRYYPIKKCTPPKYADDSCQWICTVPDYLDMVKSKYPINNVVFKKSSSKNYQNDIYFETAFGENYNSVTKKATTFIYVKERKELSNNNCINEMKEINLQISIDIQFVDMEHWRSFKSSVTKNSSFQDTWQASNDSPIEFRYGIRRRQTNTGSRRWRGVFINLYETNINGHAKISFDSWGVE
jgi:hypothetical protein